MKTFVTSFHDCAIRMMRSTLEIDTLFLPKQYKRSEREKKNEFPCYISSRLRDLAMRGYIGKRELSWFENSQVVKYCLEHPSSQPC